MEKDKCIYINDENDEIVKETPDGQFLAFIGVWAGIALFGILSFIIFCVLQINKNKRGMQ